MAICRHLGSPASRAAHTRSAAPCTVSMFASPWPTSDASSASAPSGNAPALALYDRAQPAAPSRAIARARGSPRSTAPRRAASRLAVPRTLGNNTAGSIAMPTLSADDIARLVESDRVHRAVYTDPHVFELEMERLFGRAWLLLGHESQVPNPGDFFTTRMAREPVIVARHTDGSARALINRCAHRGTTVCDAPSGTTRQFVCPDHGCTSRPDGAP